MRSLNSVHKMHADTHTTSDIALFSSLDVWEGVVGVGQRDRSPSTYQVNNCQGKV